jgi:carbon-monoxide dehydrogenase medium subunit
MYGFNYVRPASLSEVESAVGEADAELVAGGHTLIPTLKMRLAQPSTLVDLSGVTDLKGIERDGDTIRVGAMTTHAEVAGSPEVGSAIGALAKLAGGIGDPQVRHRGTIGGSIANNDPAADYPAAILGLGATVVTNRRSIAADDFFAGLFTTSLDSGEIITKIEFPIPEKAGYAKFEQRASRYALVGVFVAKSASGVRVAVTGAGENGVFRCGQIEEALAADFSPSAARVTVPADGLMSDLHGAADYRAALIAALAEDAVAAAG